MKQWSLRVLVFLTCVATSGVLVAVGRPAADAERGLIVSSSRLPPIWSAAIHRRFFGL